MQEKRFSGNSEELYRHLTGKKFELLRRRDVVTREAAKKVISHAIEQIDEVQFLCYFKNKIMTMDQLISATRNDRNNDIAYRDKIASILEKAKPEHDAEMARADQIREADPDATEDNNQELARIGEKYDEYLLLQSELDYVEDIIKARHWLLGMIHRPNGFFNKAMNAV